MFHTITFLHDRRIPSVRIFLLVYLLHHLPSFTVGLYPNPSFVESVPLFAHVRWSNFSSNDLIQLMRFRMVTIQVEPDSPLPCEEQAQDVRNKLILINNGTLPIPVLMYGNLFYAEPNCNYNTVVKNNSWLWLNESDGKTPYQPGGRYTFDMSNPEGNTSQWWVQNVQQAVNVDGGFGDNACGGPPSWFNATRQQSYTEGIMTAHRLATMEAAAKNSTYIVNCPILPQIGDKYIPGTGAEMIESWCSDFQPGGKGPANFCRDEVMESVVLNTAPWGNITLQARYYLNKDNKYNPEFGLAAFLIAAGHGSFFGASIDWDWSGDWENLLSWPWSSRRPGAPLSLVPTMLDPSGCGWTRAYTNVNVTVNFCGSHLFAQILWFNNSDSLSTVIESRASELESPGTKFVTKNQQQREWTEPEVRSAIVHNLSWSKGNERINHNLPLRPQIRMLLPDAIHADRSDCPIRYGFTTVVPAPWHDKVGYICLGLFG